MAETNFDAVAGSSNNKINPYSTTEVACGTWIDGKTVYRRVYDFGSLPNNTTKTIDSGLSGVATKIISLSGFAYNNAYNIRPLPFSDSTVTNNIRLDMNAEAKIGIVTGASWTGYNAYVYVEYIK